MLGKRKREDENVISTMPEEMIGNVLSYSDNRSKRRFSQTSTWIRDVVLRFGKVKFNLTEKASKSFYNDEENIRSQIARRYVCGQLHSRDDVIDLSCFENVQEVKLNSCLNVVDVFPLRNCKYVSLLWCNGVIDVSSLGNVNKLSIVPSARVVGFSSLGNVQELELGSYIGSCNSLSNADLSHFSNIPKLKLSWCHNISSVSCLVNNKSLELYNCDGITDVSSLTHVPLLKIKYCKGIKTWGSLIPPNSFRATPSHFPSKLSHDSTTTYNYGVKQY